MELNSTQRLPKKILYFWCIKAIFLFLLLSIPFLLVGIKPWYGIIIWLIILLGIPLSFSRGLDYKNFSFSVDENKITINQGIITKKSKCIIFDSIQNVGVASGPLMRMFGLAVLRIWTASPGQIKNGNREKLSDGALYLTLTDAKWLRDFMTRKQASLKIPQEST